MESGLSVQTVAEPFGSQASPPGAFGGGIRRHLLAPGGPALTLSTARPPGEEPDPGRFSPATRRAAWRELRARRKPRLSLRLPGEFLLRFAERQFAASFLQLPPRLTRLEPDGRGPFAGRPGADRKVSAAPAHTAPHARRP